MLFSDAFYRYHLLNQYVNFGHNSFGYSARKYPPVCVHTRTALLEDWGSTRWSRLRLPLARSVEQVDRCHSWLIHIVFRAICLFLGESGPATAERATRRPRNSWQGRTLHWQLRVNVLRLRRQGAQISRPVSWVLGFQAVGCKQAFHWTVELCQATPDQCLNLPVRFHGQWVCSQHRPMNMKSQRKESSLCASAMYKLRMTYIHN